MAEYTAEKKSKLRYLLLATLGVVFLNYLRFLLGLTFPDPVVDNVIWVGDITWRNRWFADFLVPLFVLYWFSIAALAASIVQQVAVRLWSGHSLEGYYGCFFTIVGGAVMAGFAGPYNLEFIFIQDAKVTGLPISLLTLMISFLVWLFSLCAILLLLSPRMVIYFMKQKNFNHERSSSEM